MPTQRWKNGITMYWLLIGLMGPQSGSLLTWLTMCATAASYSIAGATAIGLIASINFSVRTIYVKFIGTHQEYDAIDAATVLFIKL